MSKVLKRKYGEAATIPFSLFEIDGVDFRIDAVYAAGDVKITKDEGAETNTTNSFVDEGSKYSILLTASEMQAERISLIFIDQTATKVWLDTDLEIETYGNASAQHAFDLGTASAAQSVDNDVILQTLPLETDIVSAGAITTLSGAVVNVDLVDTTTTNTDMRGTDSANTVVPPSVAQFDARTLLAANYFDPAADTVANVTLVATTTINTDMRGTDLSFLASSAPTNFSDLAISITTGEVVVETNNDKTGYSLSQTFPSNFELMAISATGDTNSDVNKMNGTLLLGSGIVSDLWRGS